MTEPAGRLLWVEAGCREDLDTKGKLSMTTDAGQTAEHPVKAKTKRRWLQFSLRTLLMLMFAAGIGWLAYKIQWARAQWDAAVAIREVGGTLQFRQRTEEGIAEHQAPTLRRKAK